MTIVECGSIDCKHCSREGICTLDKIRLSQKRRCFMKRRASWEKGKKGMIGFKRTD